MARAGLGAGWTCLFANDFDPVKGEVYAANWGENDLIVDDVANVRASMLPVHADLVWASTPCQDLSLAGNALGLGKPNSSKRTRSGSFWPYWRLIEQLRAEGRKPRVAVFENVIGTLSPNDGADFQVVGNAFASAGYRFGALTVRCAGSLTPTGSHH